jgi:hypothetical protein
MKIFYYVFSLLFFVVSCQQPEPLPAPTEKTQVHENGEDGDSYHARMAWIELMHGGKNANWRSVEAANQMASYQEWLRNDAQQRSDEEANG